MSESTSPDWTAPARPAKRQKTDADLRRQRKREADRMAQKNSRERRRSHIDHLENMVSILRKENGNAVICELMETVLQLRAENERLRRIINAAKTSLNLVACEAPSTTNLSSRNAGNNTFVSSSTRDNNSQGASTKADEPPNKGSESSELSSQSTTDALLVRASASNNSTQNAGLNRQNFCAYLGIQRSDNSTGPLQFTDLWMDKMAAGSNARERANRDPFMFLGPLATAMPSVAHLRTGSASCPIWERSNRIYGQICDVLPAAASQALALSSAHYAHMIFKAVIHGWSALNSEERNNPIMRILGDMDQAFSELDPVSRAACMYKSHRMLKYHLDADKHRLEEIPEWHRPLLSQRIKQHPIAVDFFAWPALRDRLMSGNHNYFATSDFSNYFRQYYIFNWPFSFEDAYIYDRAANTYRISPIFERCHRNISYWGVQKPFLERFPELVHDIACHDTSSSSPLNPGTTRIEPVENVSGEAATMDKIFPGFFTEGELTELFNDYPHVA